MKRRCFQLVLLLVLLSQSVSRVVYCPTSCICVMDEILNDNMATCTFNNSVVNMTWIDGYKLVILAIECKNTVRDFQYDCNDWPQYNIASDEIKVSVSECAPSLTRCVHKMYEPTSSMIFFDILNVAGTYTPNDLVDFEKVWLANVVLKDEDTTTAAVVVNTLPFLKSITIVGGNLNLTSNVFRQPQLKALTLLGNNIQDIPEDVFIGLPNLQKLSVEGNYFQRIYANTFRGLNAVNTLRMFNNTLTSIDPGAFSHMKRLGTLDIFTSRLKTVPNGFLDGVTRTYMVNIQYNQVEMTLDSHAFANLPQSIEILKIFNCKIKELPENVFNGSNKILDVSFGNNYIEYLPPNLFATTTGLVNIYLSVNRISNVSEELFSNMKLLAIIDLSYNHLTTLKGNIFTHSRELRQINLSHNRLTHMDRDIFKGTSLVTLNLAFNKLKRIVGNSTLDWQTQIMDLSQNELSVFEDWFVEIVGLKILDLSGNRIKMIKESHIYRLNSKATLDLRNNSIIEVVRDISDPLVNVTSGISLYLSNNPLQCDCVLTTLLKEWHKYDILADYEDITCDNEGKLSNLDAYVQCNKTHAFVALVGSSAVGSLVIIVLVLTIFARRKKIWTNVMNLYESIYSRCISKSNNVNETIDMKENIEQYDLFISFAHKDADFVVDQLLPVLENDLELKVCVHYRDWVVGDLISVQIKESVKSSTMTMIILTQHFLESEWSSLEFSTAHELSIEDGKSRVIIVLIDKSVTRHDKLCGDLKAYIDMNTYLVWDDTLFWDKLQIILPKSKKNKRIEKSFK